MNGLKRVLRWVFTPRLNLWDLVMISALSVMWGKLWSVYAYNEDGPWVLAILIAAYIGAVATMTQVSWRAQGWLKVTPVDRTVTIKVEADVSSALASLRKLREATEEFAAKAEETHRAC